MKNNELVSNRKAYHDFEILETFEAGISLTGSEIKSLRNHGGSLKDAYVLIKKDELFLINSHIAPYKYSTHITHIEKRDRKLLMHKKEIEKLKKLVTEKGITLIPLSFYLKKGRIKIKFGIAKGKKRHDKRSYLKEKEQKREIDRILKSKNY